MSMIRRLRAEFSAALRSFLRRRTAVFFTFLFPVVLVVIFGALVRTRPGGGGLFTEAPEFYVPGYLATVVLFTPLSRIGSEVARHRDGHRFEKLATTPLSPEEWLGAHTLVNVGVVGAAGLLVIGLTVLLTGARLPSDLSLLLLVPFVVFGTILFCGVGAMLGRLADSQDGAIAASNGIALPLLFLSETFVPPALLPEWFAPVAALSPLTYFARGVRAVLLPATSGPALPELGILAAIAVFFFGLGAAAIPWSS